MPLHKALACDFCVPAAFRQMVIKWCVCLYLKLCRCRCATCTTMYRRKWGLREVNKLYMVFAKCGAHYIIRRSFSWIILARPLLAEMHKLEHEPAARVSFQPASRSFKKPASHPPNATVIQSPNKTIYSPRLPTAPKKHIFSLQKS